MMRSYDFSALQPGPIPAPFEDQRGWELARKPRHPRNADIGVAVNSPDYHVAFPGICKAANGDLLVVYREGLTHATRDNPRDGRVAMVRSGDGGETWGERVIVEDSADHDDRNAAIACLPDEKLLLCWDRYLLGRHHGAFFRVSEDHGHTWGEPVRLQPTQNVHTRSRGMALKDGHWLIPLGEGEGNELISASATIIDPATGHSEMIRMTPPGATNMADEVAVTRAPDDSLVALIRSCQDPWLWQTRSLDEGRTWETPWPSGIPSQYTPADLTTLNDGRLLCAFSFRERRNERLVLSGDCAATWDVENSVDVYDGVPPSGDRSYPASVQLDERTVATVLYETNPYPQGGRIYFVRTDLAEFEREPVTALYQADESAEEARIVLPLDSPSGTVAVKYRFTGKFGAPPNRLEVGIGDAAGHSLVCGYQMGATPDRSTPINAVDIRQMAPDGEQVPLQQEAVGDWFDDGNEHEFAVRFGKGSVTMLMDGIEQGQASGVELVADRLWLATRRASVAVYGVSTSE